MPDARPGDAELEETAEELYEDAPCGYLTALPDGTIVRVNRTLTEWTGHTREQLLDGRRFADLLTAGGRIYHETHYAPLLAMQGAVREIAVDVRCADGTRLPVLVNSVLKTGPDGAPRLIRTTLFNATERKRYERELLHARDRERVLRERADEVAHVLQRSLLDAVPLEDDRVAVGTRYRPAVEGLEVGGDWHDAFALGEGRVGAVVGDVVGRGIEAASAMGQLRSAARALALAEVGGPATVLELLDRFAARVPRATMATLVCVELDLATGEGRYAAAGHPPPVLLAPGAAPEALWDGRSLPLGIGPGGPARGEGRLTVPPGGRLVLYTDGLIERRGESLDVGLERLTRALAEGPDRAPQPLVDALVEALIDEEAVRDDLCVLCLGRPAA